MWDRNDLRLSFPSEDVGSFVSFSSTAKFHLPTQFCSEYKKASLYLATAQLLIDRRQTSVASFQIVSERSISDDITRDANLLS
jgi:hypothetical protein